MQKIALLFSLSLAILTITGITVSTAQDTSGVAVQITDAKLGAGVENRELTGEDSSFTIDSKVYLWMRVTGGTGETLTVTWKHGEESHSTTLNVGGSPWRTWAIKTVYATGEWTVTVSDSKGTSLKELSFSVK